MRERSSIILILAFTGLAATTSPVGAACDAAGADAADVVAARSAVAAACDCDAATSHGAYVRCARAAAKAALANRGCLGVVTRCAARSTCGRDGAVACCQTSRAGVTRASIKAQASACRAPAGAAACVSAFSSACDACTASGCAVPPTPTPSPTATAAPTTTPVPTTTPTTGCGNGIVEAGEQCDGATCSAMLDGAPVESACGAPGTLHECQCRDVECGFCEIPGGSRSVLCWPGDQCLLAPGTVPSCPTGSCVPGLCDSPADCASIAPGCENGLCCATMDTSSFCRVFDQVALPCCGAAVCVGDGLATCCLPAGESCLDGSACCSGSCTSGTCG